MSQHQGNCHPQSSRGWDRLVNPVQDLGRTLLNFLVGGNSSTSASSSSVHTQQNISQDFGNSLEQPSNISGGQKNEIPNGYPAGSSSNITIPRSTPIILRRTQQTRNSGEVASSLNETPEQESPLLKCTHNLTATSPRYSYIYFLISIQG